MVLDQPVLPDLWADDLSAVAATDPPTVHCAYCGALAECGDLYPEYGDTPGERVWRNYYCGHCDADTRIESAVSGHALD